MPVAPLRLDRIRANRLQCVESQIGSGRVAHPFWRGDFAHVGVTAFAFDTGASEAQAVEAEGRCLCVLPCDGDGASGAVCFDACWLGTHSGKRTQFLEKDRLNDK